MENEFDFLKNKNFVDKLSTYYFPTKTAQNVLNFIGKDEELILLDYSDKNIIKIFCEIILQLLPHKIGGQNLDENLDPKILYNQVLTEYRVDSISMLKY